MLPLQWQNQSMRADKMSKGEELFWRLERYAHRWPPPWLPRMRNESNPVVFLDIAIRALDRSSLFLCLPYHRLAPYALFPLSMLSMRSLDRSCVLPCRRYPLGFLTTLSCIYVYVYMYILHRYMHTFIRKHVCVHYVCMYVCMYACM